MKQASDVRVVDHQKIVVRFSKCWEWKVRLSASSHSRSRLGAGQSSSLDRYACRSRAREALENARLYPAKAVSRRESLRFRRSRPVSVHLHAESRAVWPP